MEEFLLTQEDPQTCDPLQWRHSQFPNVSHWRMTFFLWKICLKFWWEFYLGSAVAVEQIFLWRTEQKPDTIWWEAIHDIGHTSFDFPPSNLICRYLSKLVTERVATCHIGNQLGLKPAKMALFGISSKHATADQIDTQHTVNKSHFTYPHALNCKLYSSDQDTVCSVPVQCPHTSGQWQLLTLLKVRESYCGAELLHCGPSLFYKMWLLMYICPFRCFILWCENLFNLHKFPTA